MVEIILFWILNLAKAPAYLKILLVLHFVIKYVPATISFLSLVVKRMEREKGNEEEF